MNFLVGFIVGLVFILLVTRKKILILPVILCTILLISLNTYKSDEYKVLEQGMENLKAFNDSYVVTHILEAPDGVVDFINVTTKDCNYSEYADEDNNTVVTDWLSDKYYIKDNDKFAYLPDSFTGVISSRKYMYLDILLRYIPKRDGITDKGSIVVNLGKGDEPLSIYSCDLPSTVAQKILGINTISLYESIADEYKKDKVISKFCAFYLEDARRNLTCSDAKLTFGVDSNGFIRHISIDVGGLGTNLVYSMTFVGVAKNTRAEPDGLSSAVNYVDTIRDYASFVTQFDSYEDAVNNMYASEGELKSYE